MESTPRRDSGAKAGATPECAKARAALADGDYRSARQLAQQVLADPGASEAARDEARGIANATRIDRGPVIFGLLMLAVLAALFAFVLSQRH